MRIFIGENHGIFDDYDSDGENQLLLLRLYRPQKQQHTETETRKVFIIDGLTDVSTANQT